MIDLARSSEPAEAPATDGGRASAWPWALALAWVIPVALLGLVASLGAPQARWRIAEYFYADDVTAALVTLPLLLVLPLIRLRSWPRLALDGRWIAAALAGAAALVAVAGSHWVMRDYPLSMDEFMARFDASIFREGRLFAVIPAEWRPFRLPLLPQFNLLAPDGASWASTYLPVNAMALALADRLGSTALAGGAWMLVALAALYGIARRLWPDRRDAAVLAVVLLATSSQALLGAMTAYAMPAHLALNLVWLWLFTRDEKWSQPAAAAVAFAACGLHQLVFQPLFAAPFLLQALVERRWGRVLFHGLAYAAIGLFWLSYWRFFLPAGPEVAAGGGPSGLGIWLSRLQVVAANFSGEGLLAMAKNLFRFLTWQNPACVALAVVGSGLAVRRGGLLRYAVLGVVLMIAMMAVVMPYQGHGWGYRYLHGLTGSVCLLAALGWIQLTAAIAGQRRRALTVGVAALTLGSLLVLTPLRGWQARSFITPYAEAMAAIRRTQADVVVVDTTGLHFAMDLTRNDPWLRDTPKVMDLLMMRPAQVRAVCARYDVAVFDRASGSAIRPITYARGSLERLAANRRLMAELRCGAKRVLVR